MRAPGRAGTRRRNKFGAVPTVVENIRFHSKKEARRYQELRLLEQAGEIRELEIQPKFPLFVPGRGAGGPYARVHVADYVADFRYREGERGILRIEDVKGGRATKTPIYRLKKRMVEALYGIEITEV
jgi:hypothetical protein